MGNDARALRSGLRVNPGVRFGKHGYRYVKDLPIVCAQRQGVLQGHAIPSTGAVVATERRPFRDLVLSRPVVKPQSLCYRWISKASSLRMADRVPVGRCAAQGCTESVERFPGSLGRRPSNGIFCELHSQVCSECPCCAPYSCVPLTDALVHTGLVHKATLR